MSATKRYLRALRGALPRGNRRRVLAEIRHHMQDGIAAETEAGLEREDAERVVIDRLGPPEQLAEQFEPHPRRRRWIAAVAAAAVVAAIGAGLAVTRAQHATRAATIRRPAERPVVQLWLPAPAGGKPHTWHVVRLRGIRPILLKPDGRPAIVFFRR